MRRPWILAVYALLYGLMINHIDVLTELHRVPGYHLWLAGMYLAPYIPAVLLRALRPADALAYAAATSLVNDLLWGPYAAALGRRMDLLEWYAYQFGEMEAAVWWRFEAGFAEIPVSSGLMAVSIFVRAYGLMLYAAWKKWCAEAAGGDGADGKVA
jgi:hypothetical protein